MPLVKKKLTSPNLTAGNIRKGINIDGVTGTYHANILPENIKKNVVIGDVTGKLPLLNPGNLWVYQDKSTPQTTAIGKSETGRIGVIVSTEGTFRVRYAVGGNYDGWTASQVYVNGVAVGTYRNVYNIGNALTQYTEDFSLNANDQVSVYYWIDRTKTGSSPSIAYLRDFALGVTDATFTNY